MVTRPSVMRPARRHLADVRGAVQLATRATLGVADVAEGVHQSIWRTLGMPGGASPGRTGGITGTVYRSVRGIARLVGGCADAALAGVEHAAGPVGDDGTVSPRREAVLAALNGVIGDHLLATGSPLAIPMSLRRRDGALVLRDPPPTHEATGKVLLLIHGLCMNDRQWRTRSRDRLVDYGEILGKALGCTPVFLRYNSGLHPSRNGAELSAQLERLLERWPVPVDELAVVAHSMGGLVIRSACRWAEQDGSRWLARLKNLVFLGTPHHGAPLERAGSWVDSVLASTPYTASFAALGLARSAGITALRHGSVAEVGADGDGRRHRDRGVEPVTPLPRGVACFAVAGAATSSCGVLADHLVGDGLVPVHSAIGRHRDPRRDLGFAETSRWIAVRTTHLQLLRSPVVARRILRWLEPSAAAAPLGAGSTKATGSSPKGVPTER